MISKEEAKKEIEFEESLPKYPALAGYGQPVLNCGTRIKPKPRLDELDKWESK